MDRMTQFAARLLSLFAAALARLPWSWLRTLGDGVARLWRRLDAREARVARRNLALAMPGLGDAER